MKLTGRRGQYSLEKNPAERARQLAVASYARAQDAIPRTLNELEDLLEDVPQQVANAVRDGLRWTDFSDFRDAVAEEIGKKATP